MAVAITLASCFVFADDSPYAPERGFFSTTQAENWEQALITGNGIIGALVMGNPLDETVTFSHERLFMPWFDSQPIVNMAPHLQRIRDMIRNGTYRESAEFVMQLAERQGYEEMRWTDPLVPAFDLNVSLKPSGSVKNYRRAVDFATGVTSVHWRDDRGLFQRRLFVSRADNVAVMSLRGLQGQTVDCRVSLATTPDASPEEDPEEDEDPAYAQGVRDIEISSPGPLISYSSRFTRSREDSIVGHEGAALVVVNQGEMHHAAESIEITAAKEVLVFVTLDVLAAEVPDAQERLAQRLRRLPPNFDSLLARHVKIHGEIFNRVKLNLGGGLRRVLSSEALLAKSTMGNLDRALVQQLFDAGRYAILSASGNMPPTLQGIWTGTWYPPWQSDFTQNGNVPSAIASTLSANMPECMEAYLGYMESLVPHFRENARRLYGCRGILVPSRTSSHGYNTHFDDEYIHLFWTPGAAWASQFFYDYYLYTGDQEFLHRRAIPFMTEAALFFEDFLEVGEDGLYEFSPSYSPENTPANSNSQACMNATMDIALVKRLLYNLVAAHQQLGKSNAQIAKWKEMLAKMPPYKINGDGTIAEWTTSKLTDNPEHRHVSQLVALFDGMPKEISDSPQLRSAFKEVIEQKMAARRADRGGEMSFGLVQLGLASASLGEAKLAYEAVDLLANNYWYSNMVSTHNPKELFNVDICGGMPAVLVKMLVDSAPGRIHLLPALPSKWPQGVLEGSLCRGQVRIDRLAWQDLNVEVELTSQIDQKIELTVLGGIQSIDVEQGNATIRWESDTANVAIVDLRAEQTATLVIERKR